MSDSFYHASDLNDTSTVFKCTKVTFKCTNVRLKGLYKSTSNIRYMDIRSKIKNDNVLFSLKQRKKIPKKKQDMADGRRRLLIFCFLMNPFIVGQRNG
uniref:Uncharacterized protein n=1 Tax=virus sp. ct5rm7 TaxID=2827298 RepID=A0A8S5RGL0_9VIRU|nr:MAG TPA: hypothetical protein [virus sp. ct5rm7]